MWTKLMTYQEVVRKAKSVLKKRGVYGGDVRLYACDTWLKGDQINLWSYWQGYQIKDIDKGVDILLVGQDWGNPERVTECKNRIERIQKGSEEPYLDRKISPTDRNLADLFSILGCDIESLNPGKRILFTNYCLGYRKESETGGMTPALMGMDKELFDDLVKAVRPGIIICLGKITYEAVTGQRIAGFSEQLRKGIPFVIGYPGIEGVKVYGVAHCGSLGSRNVGGMINMKKAWRRIAADLKKPAFPDESPYDCGMEKGKYWFRYRTGAIIVRDGRMLFVKSMYGGYYYMLGGGVHLGETSKECIEREVYEEAGIRCKARRIAIICENFFNGRGGSIDGKECHELEYYYLMDVPDDCNASENTDESEKLVWVPIEDFAQSDIRPAFLKEKLKEVIEGGPLIHVISDER